MISIILDMNSDPVSSSELRRTIHIFEGKELAHGPLWLDYIVRSCCLESFELIVSYPELPTYEEFAAKWAAHPHVELRPFAYPCTEPRYRNALKLALQVEADLTFITFLDAFGCREHEDLLQQFNGKLAGLWFLAPRELKSHCIQRLFSRKLRKAHQLAQRFKSPPESINQIFVLDESIAQLIEPRKGLHVTTLPDPWHCASLDVSQAEARRRFNLPQDKKIFLHFGSTDTRKGIEDVIATWQEPACPSEAYLVRAGDTRQYQVDAIQRVADSGRATLINRYILNDELDALLRAADWILLPYRDHYGSSGALAGAAAARRPVVCSDSAILGRRVRENHLGLLFKHKDRASLLEVIQAAEQASSLDFVDALQAYSKTNSIEQFLHRMQRAIRQCLDS
jgi:glycosyltransferase involved in cell wall biosynthesis